MAPGGSVQEDSHKVPGQMDLFGQSDAVVKHVLEVIHCYFLCDVMLLSFLSMYS